MRKTALFLGGLLVSIVSSANATQFQGFSRADQVRGSDLIVIGRVTSLRSDWDENRSTIYTDAEVAVHEVWKGSTPGDSLSVRTLGGSVDNVMLKVDGAAAFVSGEEVVLFLRLSDGVYTPWGMTFGKYQIVGSPSDPFAIGSLPPSVPGSQEFEQVSLALGDLRAEVAAALGKEAL
jgi:hypothetical protein